jgi:ABC-type transport system involved in multi-copper enzyme maturation permease subunit
MKGLNMAMITTTTTTPVRKRQSATTQPTRPLLTVMAWEARRLRASRLSWAVALGAFALFLFILWTQRNKYSIGGFDTAHGYSFSGSVAVTSAQGFLLIVPGTVLLLFGLLLPFVAGDGVARDLTRRTHELLMSTTLPTWAYVWGRYLIGLLLSLGLAVLLLVALLVLGLAQYLTVPGYPAPQLGAVLALWCVLIVPIAVLVSSISFAAATLLPRAATLVKIGVLACWFVAAVALPALPEQNNVPDWYVRWDPTGRVISQQAIVQFDQAIQQHMQSAIGGKSVGQLLLQIEQRAPDIGLWLLPHALWAALGLVLALIAARVFTRFRTTFQ